MKSNNIKQCVKGEGAEFAGLVDRARSRMHNHLWSLIVRLLKIELCVCVCVVRPVNSSCRRPPLACWRWLCKLSDQSECGKLGPENRGLCPHGSSFSGCDWFPPSVFDTHYACEMIQLRGLGENSAAVSVEMVDKSESHYVCINSGGQLLSNHGSSLCVTAAYIYTTRESRVRSCNHLCNLKNLGYF